VRPILLDIPAQLSSPCTPPAYAFVVVVVADFGQYVAIFLSCIVITEFLFLFYFYFFFIAVASAFRGHETDWTILVRKQGYVFI